MGTADHAGDREEQDGGDRLRGRRLSRQSAAASRTQASINGRPGPDRRQASRRSSALPIHAQEWRPGRTDPGHLDRGHPTALRAQPDVPGADEVFELEEGERMGRYVLGFQEIDQTQVAVVGGKGAHLGELSRIEGIRVPAGFCVTTDAFRRIMAEAPSIDDLLDRLSRLNPDDREAIRTLSAEIRRDPRSDRHPRRSGGGDHRRARPARRASRLRRAIERDGGGLADGILRGPAGHVPERRGAGGDPPARQPLLGLALHRAGRDLPPAERLRPPAGPDGRGRAADGLPAGGRHPVHGRPRHGQPEGRLRGGQLRPRRGPGLRPGERGRLQGAGRRGRRQVGRHQAARRSTPRRPAGRRNRRSSRSGRSSRR